MSMASKATLTAKSLETLGAERLAELLMEISTGNAVAKRRLRLDLAGAQSPGELAKEVRRRLITIAWQMISKPNAVRLAESLRSR